MSYNLCYKSQNVYIHIVHACTIYALLKMLYSCLSHSRTAFGYCIIHLNTCTEWSDIQTNFMVICLLDHLPCTYKHWLGIFNFNCNRCKSKYVVLICYWNKHVLYMFIPNSNISAFRSQTEQYCVHAVIKYCFPVNNIYNIKILAVHSI